MKYFILTFLCLTAGIVLAQHPVQKKITIKVDERIELLTVMQLLYDYPLVGRADIDYKKELLRKFGKDSSNSDVRYFLKIAEEYFSFVKPINYALHYRLPDFTRVADFSTYENTNYEFAQHRDSLQLFIRKFQHYYQSSDFHSFFTADWAFYDSLVRQVQPKVDSVNLVSILEKHYGQKQHSYTLILSPLFLDGGMSTWLESPKGKDLYSIIGPNSDSKYKPVIDTRWLMQYLVMHEFSHPFCNPLIDKYYPQLAKDSVLFEPLRKAMHKEGTGSWKVTLYELLTRANEIELDRQVFGDADANAVYKDYKAKGYTYLDGLLPLIRKYDTDRDHYPTLDALMPEIVGYFDSAAKK